MKIQRFLLIVLAMFGLGVFVSAQQRTTTKTDRFDFGSGGTITITGAPNGSIKVVGTSKNEIEITATIGIEAANDTDFAKLAEVTGFVADDSTIRTAIGSIGPHNKFGLKKLPKNFPKNLLSVPFRIDYEIRVPRYSDLEIDGGKGDLSITGVEGSMLVNFIEAKGYAEVISGISTFTIGTGSLDVAFGPKNWRGRSANINVGKGDLNLRLPSTLSADIDATVLKTGSIDNAISDLKPRDRKVAFTDRSVVAKAGVGGPSLKFTVGDGKLKMERLVLSL